MKKVRKLTAVLTVVFLLAGMMVPSIATSTYDKVSYVAQLLGGLGLLTDDGNGIDDAYVTRDTDKIEAALMQLRLLGLEENAAIFDGQDTFTDENVPDSQKNILAFLKASPQLGWKADAQGKFNPSGNITEQEYYKALLIALGYVSGTDFTDSQTISFARDIGLYVSPVIRNVFMISDFTNATLSALRTETKGTAGTLADAIAQRDAVLGELLADNHLLTVPGGNMAPNSGFEGTGGWYYFNGAALVFSGNTVYRGDRALVLTRQNNGVKSDRLAIEAGEAYSVTAWVHGRVNVIAALYGQNGIWLSSYQNVMDGGRTGAWVKLDDVIKINNPDVEYIDITFTPVDETVFIDEVKMMPVTGRPLAKELWAAKTTAPAPKVGCYYFNNWVMADQWSHVKYFEEGPVTPVIGYYRDASPEVQEWHIQQAKQHGISFWIFDLYYDIASDTILGNNAALNDGFLNADSCEDMEFAVMWCNEEADFTTYTEQQLLRMVETMGENYFSRSNYLKSPDGRNIFAMTRPDRLIDKHGVEGTRELLRKMDEAAAEWGGLFFLTVKQPTVGNVSQLQAAGFDAVTMYSYSNEGMGSGKSDGPYNTILPYMDPLWRSSSKNGVLPVVPVVSPNWDSRPLAGVGGRGSWRTGSTPELFGEMCDTFKNYVDPELNMMMVGTWNEFGEGSYIEPTVEKGCDYLDAMQQSFFPEEYEPHTVAVPTNDELERMQYSDIPPLDPPIPPDGNLVPNPGFESDYGWVVFDNSRINYSTEIVHGGNQSMILTQAQNGVKAVGQIQVRPGMEYAVSVWVYGKARLRSALFSSTTWLGTYADIAEGGQQGQWTMLEGVFTADDPNIASFDVEIFYDDEGEDIYIDDASVKIIETGSENNIIPNPGFEEDGGWVTFLDGFAVSSGNEPVRGGDRSFKLEKSHSGMKTTEKFPYAYGDSYEVSLWTYGKTSLLVGIYDASGGFIGYQYTDIEGGGQGRWQELTGDLTMSLDDPDAAMFDIQIVNGEEATSNQIDNSNLEGSEVMWYAFSGNLQWDTGLAHSGVKSMKVSPANGGVKYWPNLAVRYGKTYTVSAWVYGEVTVMAAQFDEAGGLIGYYTDVAHGGTAGSWKQITARVTIGNPAIDAINIEFRPGSSDVNVDDICFVEVNDVFIDDVSVIKGTLELQ